MILDGEKNLNNMILIRQKNFTAYDVVGDTTKLSTVKSNNRRVKRGAAIVGFKKKINQGITNFKLGRVQRQVNKGNIDAAQGSLLAGNIMEQYHNKNQGYLNKAKQRLGRPITSATPTGAGLAAISGTTNITAGRGNTNNTQQNNGQGASILQGLKDTWGGMTNTQKNVARLGAGALAIGGTIAITNAIKNRQRRKAEEEDRRSNMGRRGGVVMF
jgi:hypothetical protein